MKFVHDFITNTRKIIQIRLAPDPTYVDFTIFHDLLNFPSHEKNFTNKKSNECFHDFFKPIDFHHPLLFFWRFLDLFFVLFSLFKLTFEACFQEKIDINEDKSLGLFSMIFSFFGVCLNFNTKFLYKGKIESSHSLIFWTYVKSSFFIDFVGFLALLWNYTEDCSYVSLIYIVKILSLMKFFKYFDEHSSHLTRFRAIYSTIFWMLHFCVTLHFISCLFFLIEINLPENNNSFFKREALLFSSKFQKYLFSLYFINANINIFGRSLDNMLQNQYEIIWVILINIISLGFLVFLYQTIFTKNHMNELYTLDKFMKKKAISPILQRKINNYLQYVYQKEQNSQNPEKIISKMGNTLKKQLFTESYLPIIRSIPFFSKNFSENTLSNLSAFVQEKSYKPGELILEVNSISKHFYYIVKGELDLFFGNISSENNLKKLSRGDSFNESAFFQQNIEKLNVKSVHNSHLLMISVDDFLTVIRKDPKDYEIYCQLKDSIFLYEDYTNLYKHCIFCKNPSHILSKCPLIHYNPSSLKIISTSHHKDNVSRKLFTRGANKIKKTNALKNYKKISQHALRIQSNYSIDQASSHHKKSNSQRGRKESSFFNDENTSSSSFTYTTQKKRVHDSPLLSPLLPPLTSDSFSHQIFNRLNEERMVYRHFCTTKSIISDLTGFDASNSSDLKEFKDFNKLKKNINKFDSYGLLFDKPTISSFSFDEVKIWPLYFPQNNILTILDNLLGHKSKKASILTQTKKEENLNQTKNSLISILKKKKKNAFEEIGFFQKFKKKKTMKKSKTEIQTNLNRGQRRKTFIDRIKTFFKA